MECWKRLAEAHNFGTVCSAPNVVESTACALLAGKHQADNRLPYVGLGPPKDAACDYLLAEDLPTWATPLRLCAAGVLVGDGDQRSMAVLLEAPRAVPAECQVPWRAGVFAISGNAEAPPRTFPETCDDKCGQIVLTVTTRVVRR